MVLPPAINIGIMALTDCLPLIIAKEQGFFADVGIEVNLLVQPSWATLRDRLDTGELHAAQVLAPMPLASNLGLHGVKSPWLALLNMSYNGNAITLSNALFQELESLVGEPLSMPVSADIIKLAVQKRSSCGEDKIRFAVVYPYSGHYYQLRDWLMSADINIDDDIDIVVIPPQNMEQALGNSTIDGCCVGTPYNAKAVRNCYGATVITANDIWPHMPEKILATTAYWQSEYPQQTLALIAATERACQWLHSSPNRFEAARLLQQYIDAPLDVIAPSLLNSCLVSANLPPRLVLEYNSFAGDVDNAPSLEQAAFILQKMHSAGQIESAALPQQDLRNIYRSDLYRNAIKYAQQSKTLQIREKDGTF